MTQDIDVFYQCTLTRGSERTTGWLPERGARQGASVQLLDLDCPSMLWTVVEVHKPPFSKQQLADKQKRDRNALPSIVGMVR